MVKKISKQVLNHFFVCRYCDKEHQSDYHYGGWLDRGEVLASMCETRCKRKEQRLRNFTVFMGGKV